MNIRREQISYSLTLAVVLIVILFVHKGISKPLDQQEHKREKRSGISDQRLAELETLLELKRLRENSRTRTPIAYGLIDPDKIGKRRKRAHHLKTYDSDGLTVPQNELSETIPPLILKAFGYRN